VKDIKRCNDLGKSGHQKNPETKAYVEMQKLAKNVV